MTQLPTLVLDLALVTPGKIASKLSPQVGKPAVKHYQAAGFLFPTKATSLGCGGAEMTSVQPASISSQLPGFYRPFQAVPQRFTADLYAVPEPSTWLLLSTGLSAAAYWRRRRQ